MGTIQLRDVSKSFGAATIIPKINLDIEEGEFVVFVGPSGCGKTTLLRMIAGLESTSGGKILIDGRDVTYEVPAKRQLAMVFQSYALYPHMTVEKNIAFPLKMARRGKADDPSQGRRGRRASSTSATTSSAAPASSPAASASASPSAAPSSASRSPSCSTSRCPTSTQHSAARCGSRSSSCTTTSAPR